MKKLLILALVVVAFIIGVKRPSGAQQSLGDPGVIAALEAGQSIGVPEEQLEAEFEGIKLNPPTVASLNALANVLGITTIPIAPFDDSKRIEVDLTNQKVYAFEGDTKVYEFIVSTGKWGRTPTGEFRIWSKVKSQKMSGGSRELNTYYYLPNVPWVMFFYNDKIAKMRGFSFHGTYWHSNFGTPMSHGCVNMKTEEAKMLYEWANPVVTNPKAWSTNTTAENPGTRVIIYGTTPKS